MAEPIVQFPTAVQGKLTRRDFEKPAAYALYYPATGMSYVGSTQNLYNRVNQHRTRLLAGTHRNQQMQEAFNTDPRFDLSFHITETKEEALTLEHQSLQEHHGSGKLFNLSSDAYVAGRGQSLSSERRRQISQSTQDQFKDPATRTRHSQIIHEKWKDPQYRAKQESRRPSDEQREFISSTLKDKWQDESYRTQMIEARKHRRRSVVIEGVEYESLTSAAQSLGLPLSTLKSRVYRSQ